VFFFRSAYGLTPEEHRPHEPRFSHLDWYYNRGKVSVAWKRLDDVVDQVSVSKADLIRAGLQMIIDKGLPDLSDEELKLLLEVEDEQVRFGQKPPDS